MIRFQFHYYESLQKKKNIINLLSLVSVNQPIGSLRYCTSITGWVFIVVQEISPIQFHKDHDFNTPLIIFSPLKILGFYQIPILPLPTLPSPCPRVSPTQRRIRPKVDFKR